MIFDLIRLWKALIKSRGNCAFLEDVLSRTQVLPMLRASLVCLKVVTLTLAQERECRKVCALFGTSVGLVGLSEDWEVRAFGKL